MTTEATFADRERAKNLVALAIGGGEMYSFTQITLRLVDSFAEALATTRQEVWKEAIAKLKPASRDSTQSCHCLQTLEAAAKGDK